jgi:hypothetical protein
MLAMKGSWVNQATTKMHGFSLLLKRDSMEFVVYYVIRAVENLERYY